MNTGIKFSDGAIVCLTIALMGAPQVLGDRINHVSSMFLFYGGIAALAGFIVWKTARLRSSRQIEPAPSNYSGRDNSGIQQVIHGGVHYHTPATPRAAFETETDGRICARGAELPTDLDFTIARATTSGQINMDEVKFIREPAPPPPTTSYLPNWPIRELFFLINPDVLTTNSQDEFESVGQEILDKLSTGAIAAWGRIIEGSQRLPLSPIPESYWQHAKLNIWLLESEAEGGNVLQAAPRNDRSPVRSQYAEIQINKLQAEMAYAPISLRDAACLAYSKVEGTKYEEIICGLNKTVEERISYFEYAMLMYPCRMYGKRLPSPVTREIPQSVIGRLHPVEGKNELTSDFAAESQKYVEVTVNQADFNRYARERLLSDLDA